MALSTTIGYSKAVYELKKRQREAAAALSSFTRYVISTTTTIESGFKSLRLYRYEQLGVAGEAAVTVTDSVGTISTLYQGEEVTILPTDQKYNGDILITISNLNTLVLIEKVL